MNNAAEEAIMQHVEGEEINEAANNLAAMVNLRKTRRIIERKHLLSVYLKHKKRIERLTISIILNTDKQGNHTSFNVRKWEREMAASLRKVRNITFNNF